MDPHDTQRMKEIQAELHRQLPADPALRVKALESLMVEKGLVDSRAVDRWIEVFSEAVGPKNGARVVARAWVDPAFKARLLADATEAALSLGCPGYEGLHLKALENTPQRHNLVVCTLCSCYPWSVLGLPPAWYKSNAYRARAVRDPRGVLKEFGLALSEEVEIRVWDSTSELRYLVIPERPTGSEGLSEEALAALITRNAMIGVERLAPVIGPRD